MPSHNFSPIFDQLRTISTRAATLRRIAELLSWDQETGMPVKAIEARGQQTALISELEHKIWTSDEFAAALGQLVDLETGDIISSNISESEKIAATLTYKDWKHARAIPTEFVSRYSELTSQAQHHWAIARKENNFSLFEPYLQQIIDMTREKALFFPDFSTPYDALLDEFEPGMTIAQLNPLFEDLTQITRRALSEIQKQGTFTLAAPILGEFDPQIQLALSHEMLRDIGYEFDRGRLDISTHPFTTALHHHDVRITTRIDPQNLLENISSTLHEGGHGLYELGLQVDWFGTPIGEACSLGIHESQSRFWENRIGKSLAFVHAYQPLLARQFPKPYANLGADSIYQSWNRVHPDLIRVQADEVTYNLHIMIRYEIEQMMMVPGFKVSALSEIWNEKMKDYLGITPKSDTEGVLQDVHWSCGLIGYFPTYALGNLVAAQLNETITRDIPEIDTLIQTRKFGPILDWLRSHIHQYGRRFSAPDLVKAATGQVLDTRPFARYLEQKFNVPILENG